MTHRERILTALQHKEPDHVPLDFASHNCSGITARAYEGLRVHLGVPPQPPPAVFSKKASTVIPDETILRRYDVDARPLLPGSPDARPDKDIAEGVVIDEWGVTWSRHGQSHFYATDGPFHHLDEPTLKDLEAYSWPDPADPGRFRGLRERARKLRRETDYAIVLSFNVGPMTIGQWIRGFSQWLSDLLINPLFSQGLTEGITDFWIKFALRALEEVGEYIDITMFGDDLGVQQGPIIKPELYRRMLKPWHKKIVEVLKQRGNPVLFHCCGSIVPFIPDLIDVGIAALNPVQVSAADMDTLHLKKEFGRDISFWGAIDSQGVLARGTPEDVRKEVKHRIEDLARDGGYVLCATHNLQPEVKAENIEAMYAAGLDYGKY